MGSQGAELPLHFPSCHPLGFLLHSGYPGQSSADAEGRAGFSLSLKIAAWVEGPFLS